MGSQSDTTTRFALGHPLVTPGALAALARYQVNPLLLLGRHLAGDWGDVGAEDAQSNEDALQMGGRLFSVYSLSPPSGMGDTLEPTKVWVITEADRSVTTLLLPEEY